MQIGFKLGNTCDIFLGNVALAGADSALWMVSGGNKQVPEALLKHSRAKLIRDRVSSITLTPKSQYALEANNVTRLYDFVIIACPQIESSHKNIQLVGIPNLHSLPKYQRTVATFVHGELNYTYFDCGGSAKPNQFFSVNQSLFFSAVAMVYPITPNKNYDHRVFKVFSKENLTNEQLDLLFSKRHNVVVEDWYAYPIYNTKMPQIPFVIHENLFYLNSIELAASAMEMSAISGKNMALLVYNKMKQKHY